MTVMPATTTPPEGGGAARSAVAVGIVGAGAAGGQHAAALAAAPGAVLAAVADADGTRAEELARAHGVAAVDVDVLLRCPDVGAVSLATPPGSHTELAVAALRAGKAVVVEKPATGSVAGCRAIVDEARRARLPALVMCQHRFELDDVPRHGWTGDAVATVETSRFRPVERFGRGSWRGDARESGGGVLAHLAVHQVDLACQLLGDPVELAGWLVADGTSGVDTRGALVARFASGALLTVSATCRSPENQARLVVRAPGRTLEVTRHRVTVDGDRGEAGVDRPAVPGEALRARVFDDLAGLLGGTLTESVVELERTLAAVWIVERAGGLR